MWLSVYSRLYAYVCVYASISACVLYLFFDLHILIMCMAYVHGLCTWAATLLPRACQLCGICQVVWEATAALGRRGVHYPQRGSLLGLELDDFVKIFHWVSHWHYFGHSIDILLSIPLTFYQAFHVTFYWIEDYLSFYYTCLSNLCLDIWDSDGSRRRAWWWGSWFWPLFILCWLSISYCLVSPCTFWASLESVSCSHYFQLNCFHF